MKARSLCSEYSEADLSKKHIFTCFWPPGSFALPAQTARMNASVAALTLFLIAAFLLPAQAQPGQNSACCFSYTKQHIPLKKLVSYEVTSRCSLPAIVFITKRNLRFCADPEEAWTQDRMRQLSKNGRQKNP